MKRKINKLQIMLISFFLIGCTTQKAISEIIYFLPSSVNEKLSEEIKRRGKEVYLVLDKGNEGTYVIYMNNKNISAEKFWVENSNRKVYLEGKLIPLYFYSDEYFSHPQNNILKKIEKEEEIKKVLANRENSFQIKFDLAGQIVE